MIVKIVTSDFPRDFVDHKKYRQPTKVRKSMKICSNKNPPWKNLRRSFAKSEKNDFIIRKNCKNV